MNAVLAEGRWLHSLALNLAGPERADDVVQETLLTAGPEQALAAANSTTSNLSLSYLMQQVKDFRPLLQECYDNAQATDPELEGKLALELTIIGDKDVGGLVEEAKILPAESTPQEA